MALPHFRFSCEPTLLEVPLLRRFSFSSLVALGDHVCFLRLPFYLGEGAEEREDSLPPRWQELL